jgi:hypothetical protein
MKPHRGKILAIAVEQTGRNKEEVAIKAGYSRSAYYKHIELHDLPYHIMAAYGKAIRHDFTIELPEMPKYIVSDPEEMYGKPITLDEAIRQIDLWKDKYVDLLEKYNRLIEEKMKEK